MNIDITVSGDIANIVIDGNIDAASSITIDVKFQDVMNNPNIKNAALDLKGVNSINSAGIGKILKFYKHFNQINGNFKIVHISSRLFGLFKDINLDKIIPISE